MKKVALEYLLIYIIEGFHKWNKSHRCDFRKKKSSYPDEEKSDKYFLL